MTSTAFTIRPATSERFDDVATVLGPRNPDSAVCWCLTYRLPSKENRALTGRERAQRVQELCARPIPPGVLAYDGGTVVGWCGVAPRAELHSFAHSRRIPHVDDLPVWAVWCFRVRGGQRGRGVAQALLEGAVEHARGLLRAGWDVHVLERSPGLPDTGTALGMWPEAMRALDLLGAGDQVRAASVEQRGARILRPETVAEMSRNQIGDILVTKLLTRQPERSADAEFFPGMPKKWGLGFMLNTAEAPTGRSAGSLAWAGLGNTYFWIDPRKRVAGVILMQYLPFADPKAIQALYAYETEVYKAAQST